MAIESGREDHPFILESDIGGNGDPDNYWTVNGFSWNLTIEQFWVPTNCVGRDDKYPLCSLKRALRSPFGVPSAKEIGDTIINNPTFMEFVRYSHISGSVIHLIDDTNFFTQSYEPIWYLFHSAIQFH